MPVHASDSDTDPPGSLVLARESIARLRRHAAMQALAQVAGAGAGILFLHAAVPPATLGAWLLAVLLVAAAHGLAVHRVPEAHDAAQARWALRGAFTFALATGAAWGIGWVALAPDLDRATRMALLLLSLAALLPAACAHGLQAKALQALVVAALLPVVAWMAWPSNGVPWPLAAAVALLLAALVAAAGRWATALGSTLHRQWQDSTLHHELARERNAAIAANVSKSRFIAAASHDLRQPMHALSIQLESLDIPGVPASARGALARIRSSVGNLNAMFESLLDVSRLDGAVRAPVYRMFRLPDFAARLAEVAAPLAARKGIGFRVQALEGAVCGDEKLLRQVVLNLLGNAVAYTVQGEVSLRFVDDEGLLTVQVSDTGCGIGEDDRPRIFDEFFRADSTRGQQDGLGLGLSIVRRVCELIGASVEVQSEVGSGSTFRVRTPYRLQPWEAARAAGEPRRPEAAAIPSLHGKWIAVIDDDPNIVEAYRDAFGRRGAHVAALPEDPDAMDLELATLSRLDLIVTDHRLRHTTGDQVIQRLRESFNADIPAVVVTADTRPGLAAQVEAMGVLLLHKPLAFRTLLATAESLLLPPAVRGPASGRVE